MLNFQKRIGKQAIFNKRNPNDNQIDSCTSFLSRIVKTRIAQFDNQVHCLFVVSRIKWYTSQVGRQAARFAIMVRPDCRESVPDKVRVVNDQLL